MSLTDSRPSSRGANQPVLCLPPAQDGVICGGSERGGCLAFFLLSFAALPLVAAIPSNVNFVVPCNFPLHLQLRVAMRKKYGLQVRQLLYGGGPRVTRVLLGAVFSGACALATEHRLRMWLAANPSCDAPP